MAGSQNVAIVTTLQWTILTHGLKYEQAYFHSVILEKDIALCPVSPSISIHNDMWSVVRRSVSTTIVPPVVVVVFLILLYVSMCYLACHSEQRENLCGNTSLASDGQIQWLVCLQVAGIQAAGEGPFSAAFSLRSFAKNSSNFFFLLCQYEVFRITFWAVTKREGNVNTFWMHCEDGLSWACSLEWQCASHTTRGSETRSSLLEAWDLINK